MSSTFFLDRQSIAFPVDLVTAYCDQFSIPYSIDFAVLDTVYHYGLPDKVNASELFDWSKTQSNYADWYHSTLYKLTGDLQINASLISPSNLSVGMLIFNRYNDKQYRITDITNDLTQVVLFELGSEERVKPSFLEGRFYLADT